MTTELMNKTGLSQELQQKLDEANGLFASGDYRQAINSLKEVIRAEPECIPALSKLASCCIKINSKDDAVAIFRRIIEIRPKRQITHAKLARLLNQKEAYAEAAKEFKTAISIKAEQPDWVFFGLAKALRKLKVDNSNENY